MDRTNTTPNPKLQQLRIAPIAMKDARRIVLAKHYMRTWPQGARLAFGVMDGNKAVGVAVFGYSTATDTKAAKLAHDLTRDEYIEMQRLWISDAYGHSTESFVLSKIMRWLRDQTSVKIVVTHAGGCKNDCGVVYQASAWLYFGSDPCSDFYLTTAGEYKNIVAAMRFGRIDHKGKSRQAIGEELFGPGCIVDSRRYLYAYPLHKGIRRRLQRVALPYPKESANFRFQQAWVTDTDTGRA